MGGHFVYFHTFSGWVCAIRVRIKAKRLVFRVRKDKTFLDLKIWNTCHVAIIRRILKFKFKFTNLKDYLCYFKFVEILKCLPFINYKAYFEFQFHKFEGLPILFQTCQFWCTLSTSKLLIVLDWLPGNPRRHSVFWVFRTLYCCCTIWNLKEHHAFL